MAALKKTLSASVNKAGESAFKLLPDGSFFNANNTIAESFKIIEEAIAASGANDEDRKVFGIGLNCDADAGYNKDPKDPNKYE